jgi:hypothetical protein
MFRPHTVAIFRKEFFEGVLQRTLKQFANIKCQVSGKSLKSMLKNKILIKLFVLSCVDVQCMIYGDNKPSGAAVVSAGSTV